MLRCDMLRERFLLNAEILWNYFEELSSETCIIKRLSSFPLKALEGYTEIDSELKKRWITIWKQICSILDTSIAYVASEIQKESPDFEKINQIISNCKSNLSNDEYLRRFTFLSFSTALTEIFQILNKRVKQLHKEIEICWKNGEMEKLLILLNKADNMMEIEEFYPEEDLSDNIKVILSNSFRNIEINSQNPKYSYKDYNKDLKQIILYNEYGLCDYLGLKDDWECIYDHLLANLDSKLKKELLVINSEPKYDKEYFENVVRVLDYLNHLTNYDFLRDRVSQIYSLAIKMIWNVLNEIETNNMFDITTLRNSYQKLVIANQYLRSFLPDLRKNVIYLEEKLQLAIDFQLKAIENKLQMEQFEQVQRDLHQFDENKKINLYCIISKYFTSKLTELQSLCKSFRLVDEVGNINEYFGYIFAKLCNTLKRGTIFEEFHQLDLSKKLLFLGVYINFRLQYEIERNLSEKISLLHNILFSESLSAIIEVIKNLSINVDKTLQILHSKRNELLNMNSFDWKTVIEGNKICYNIISDISNRYEHLTTNIDFYGREKIREFESEFNKYIRKEYINKYDIMNIVLDYPNLPKNLKYWTECALEEKSGGDRIVEYNNKLIPLKKESSKYYQQNFGIKIKEERNEMVYNKILEKKNEQSNNINNNKLINLDSNSYHNTDDNHHSNSIIDHNDINNNTLNLNQSHNSNNIKESINKNKQPDILVKFKNNVKNTSNWKKVFKLTEIITSDKEQIKSIKKHFKSIISKLKKKLKDGEEFPKTVIVSAIYHIE